MKIKIKRKKHFKMKYIIVILAIILIFIGTSYSLFSTTLHINARVTGKYEIYEIVPVSGSQLVSYDGFTYNSVIGSLDVLNYKSDIWDEQNNTLTTNVTQGQRTLFTSTVTVTINFTIKNVSSFPMQAGTITKSKNPSDTSSYVNPTGTPTLSPKTIAPGGTATFTGEISVRINRTLNSGYYANFLIPFTWNGKTINFNYKFLIVSN